MSLSLNQPSILLAAGAHQVIGGGLVRLDTQCGKQSLLNACLALEPTHRDQELLPEEAHRAIGDDMRPTGASGLRPQLWLTAQAKTCAPALECALMFA
ncbi:hypothetical protein KR51_00007030 [Rubidibacter lacunae KORDI 51-2]|uniref:Uncharacterized protein n=1 Tax=Rubidibacter lacunae KORDI 51-2 TaxID=582515 RepID=U5DSF9_9CHRO|nr:hypothetical protein [Rubidibacter lacunae]ERN42610.1 hypothetical protein KR51_00007030 [Rubidibacter lacunae KORDI 51-2]